MNEDLVDRVRAANRACTRTVSGHRHRSPAEVLEGLAAACRELGIEEWDSYGERGPVARLESEVSGLLGTEAAAFFPSGVMAQQVALRIWCDRAGTRRVAVPDLSHLLVHELDGPRILQDLQVEHLTTGHEVATAKHLGALPGRLAAVLVEVPLRDAGCLVPTYDELAGLSAACRERACACTWTGRGSGRRRPTSAGRCLTSPRSPIRRTSRSTRASAGWPARLWPARSTS